MNQYFPEAMVWDVSCKVAKIFVHSFTLNSNTTITEDNDDTTEYNISTDSILQPEPEHRMQTSTHSAHTKLYYSRLIFPSSNINGLK